MVLLLVVAYSDHANGAGFRSEDELIEETRAKVEKHLNGDRQAFSSVTKEESVPEAPRTVKESPVIKAESPPAKEEPAPVVENKPVTIKTPAVVQAPPPVVKKEKAPSDVITIDPESSSVTESDKEAVGEDVKFVRGIKEPVQVKPLVEPVLKRMDVSKIGSSPYYETYEGLRLLKYFTVAQRVEIYQEARPIDAYIMDAFAIRYGDWPHRPWNIKSDYRTQLTPIFTRAYGTEITMSDPKNKEGQIRYTHDYREIYKNYFPKWPQIQREMWDQNEVLFMHSKQIEPIGWNYTSNLGYRYSTLSDKEAPTDIYNSYYEIRHTYFGSLSLAPSEKLEWFGQAEYYKSQHVKCSWASSPDHFLGRTELRIKSNDMKTMYVPSFSYSKDYYYPFASTYQKYEIQFRVGRDFTKRFSASSTVKYVMGLRDEPDHDNDWGRRGREKHGFKDKAYAISLENRFSYNVYDRLYLQAGLDISNGLNWSIFDNLGLLGGLEYYAPGMIRVDFGWKGNYYYNLQDFLSSVYFKFYLFM
ncbi:MAG: hypothetical protein NTY34_02855 [Candidatus Omnitrophica bacterium]|nr:hypothetical protein [Candidatus Omnitrophota bacterium]